MELRAARPTRRTVLRTIPKCRGGVLTWRWLTLLWLGLLPLLLAGCVGDLLLPDRLARTTPTPAEPAAGVLVLAASLAPSPTPEPTPSPTTAPTRTPLPTAVPTATPAPTLTTTPSPTASATLRPTQTPTATRTVTTTPTPRPAVWAPNAPHLIVHGKPETGVVALTFDAGGRDPGETGSVLDTLRQAGFLATFFLTGEWSEANPALVKRMAAERHELANHTYDHPHLTKVSDEEILAQVTRTEQVVQRVAGVSLKKLLRPPFGDYDQRVLAVLGRRGYDVAYWTLDSGDWRPEMSAQDVAQRVGSRAGAGDVVVFHSYPAKTAQALPAIVAALKARGLRGGTMTQVLGGQAPGQQP